jgi:hypothetical protein
MPSCGGRFSRIHRGRWVRIGGKPPLVRYPCQVIRKRYTCLGYPDQFYIRGELWLYLELVCMPYVSPTWKEGDVLFNLGWLGALESDTQNPRQSIIFTLFYSAFRSGRDRTRICDLLHVKVSQTPCFSGFSGVSLDDYCHFTHFRR